MSVRLLTAAALALVAGTALAQDAPSGEITVWSWDIAASSLEAVVEGFNAEHPDVTVIVEDLGNQQVFDRTLAACAAGGQGLPDVISIENQEAEIFWAQFPDCFANLRDLGYTDEVAGRFPDFKRAELEVGGAAFAMPWDAGPVAMFYRRDLYEQAGIDAASIETWDDFIAAGQQLQDALDDVRMTQANLNGDTEFFRMIANEQDCFYFSGDGQEITVNQPGCVAALETIKALNDAGVLGAADWGEKIQSMAAGTVATQMFGGWYEGTVRTNVPEDQSGNWGVYRMPTVEDGPRAANIGGSALGIPSASENQEAAYAFIEYALGTNDGQLTMLREYGLVPSLLSALDADYVAEPLEFWGGEAIWETILGTLGEVPPVRGTPFFADAGAVVQAVQTQYLNGGFDSAQAALDDAAQQLTFITGLSVAE